MLMIMIIIIIIIKSKDIKMYKDKKEKTYRIVGRWTVARQTILDVFLKLKGHFTADDVYLEVRRMHPGIGIATVYRNLEFLTQQELLNRYQFGEAKARYELNDDERNHHHHIICTKCGTIKDYSEFIERELMLMKEMSKKLSRKHNYEIRSHQLHFYGLCSKCQDH
jgi:Fur family ferric uptake transcriptional regulator